MLYNVISFTKQVVPAGKQNAGTNYAVVTIEDPEDGERREVPVFDAEAKRYLDLAPAAVIGTAVPLPDNAPDNLKVWKNCFDKEFTFPETMVRVNAQGQPELNKFNQMRVRNSVLVMTRYKKDNETGELAIRRGWDLTTRGTSIMNAFYMPLRVFNNTAGGAEQQAITDAGQANANLPV